MEPRLDYGKVLPAGLRAVNVLEHYSQTCGLEPALLELVKLRASQLNGCAHCVDMHSKDARSGGESEQRLYGPSVRLAITFGDVPGSYAPEHFVAARPAAAAGAG
jgi:AhpD family alkylhydroperoxidase